MDADAAQPGLRAERGQTMAEYAVVLAVITAGILLAIGTLSNAIGDAISTIAGRIPV